MNGTATAPYGAFLLRLALGVMAVYHGGTKLMDLGGTAGFFSSVGLPGALAYLVMAVEVVGGVLLILGLFTRWVALAIAAVLVGAIVFVHLGMGGTEYPLFLLAASLAVALLGSGAFAVRSGRAA
jgi:putative oxidoreductase